MWSYILYNLNQYTYTYVSIANSEHRRVEMTSYFSDRERGPSPRINEEITGDVWGGIISLIESCIRNDYFGEEFPALCPDGYGVIGLDKRAMALTIRAELPELNWPQDMNNLAWGIDLTNPPTTLTILDLIEFCHRSVAKPIQDDYHSFFVHHHLSFDRQRGQAEFREKIERILARNGLAYELQDNGQIVRLGSPILREDLQALVFQTGDTHLDALLEASRAKYFDPDPSVRRESLEKLWDAWERLKTVIDPTDKKKSITILLDKASSEPHFRERLEREAKELTDIGNNFMIRHTETGKTPISSNEQVDYLFQRLFALIYLLLKVL